MKKERTVFDGWWSQSGLSSISIRNIQERIWNASKVNAIILLRKELTETSNLFERAAIKRCVKVLEVRL